jgi:hypothetical protein
MKRTREGVLSRFVVDLSSMALISSLPLDPPVKSGQRNGSTGKLVVENLPALLILIGARRGEFWRGWRPVLAGRYVLNGYQNRPGGAAQATCSFQLRRMRPTQVGPAHSPVDRRNFCHSALCICRSQHCPPEVPATVLFCLARLVLAAICHHGQGDLPRAIKGLHALVCPAAAVRC